MSKLFPYTKQKHQYALINYLKKDLVTGSTKAQELNAKDLEFVKLRLTKSILLVDQMSEDELQGNAKISANRLAELMQKAKCNGHLVARVKSQYQLLKQLIRQSHEAGLEPIANAS